MAVVQCIQLWILIRSSCCYLKAKDRTKDSLDLQDQGQEQELDPQGQDHGLDPQGQGQDQGLKFCPQGQPRIKNQGQG